METDLVVIGIDPSTVDCGVAVVAFDAQGKPSLIRSERLGPQQPVSETSDKSRTAECLRFGRIWRIREKLHGVVHSLACCYDLVAYEFPNTRGATATAAINQAIGAYLSHPALCSVSVLAVSARSAGAVYDKSFGSKKEDKKAAGVAWAKDTFGVWMTEAEADACAVAVAARELYLNPKKKTVRRKKANETARL